MIGLTPWPPKICYKTRTRTFSAQAPCPTRLAPGPCRPRASSRSLRVRPQKSEHVPLHLRPDGIVFGNNVIGAFVGDEAGVL